MCRSARFYLKVFFFFFFFLFPYSRLSILQDDGGARPNFNEVICRVTSKRNLQIANMKAKLASG